MVVTYAMKIQCKDSLFFEENKIKMLYFRLKFK